VRDRHLERMRAGTCKAQPALSFSDIVVSMRRIKNHTVNLFEAAIYQADEPVDTVAS